MSIGLQMLTLHSLLEREWTPYGEKCGKTTYGLQMYFDDEKRRENYNNKCFKKYKEGTWYVLKYKEKAFDLDGIYRFHKDLKTALREMNQFNASMQCSVLELLTFNDGVLELNNEVEDLFFTHEDILNKRVDTENMYLYGAILYEGLLYSGITDEAISLLHEPWFSEYYKLNNIVHDIRVNI